jgi:hypothetical protein
MKKIKKLKKYKTETYTDETCTKVYKVFEEYNHNEFGDKINEIIDLLQKGEEE